MWVLTPGEGEDQVTLSSTFLSLLLLFLPSFSFSPSLSFSLALPLISLCLSPFISLPSSYSAILTNIPAEPGWEQQVKKKGGKILSQSGEMIVMATSCAPFFAINHVTCLPPLSVCSSLVWCGDALFMYNIYIYNVILHTEKINYKPYKPHETIQIYLDGSTNTR